MENVPSVWLLNFPSFSPGRHTNWKAIRKKTSTKPVAGFIEQFVIRVGERDSFTRHLQHDTQHLSPPHAVGDVLSYTISV